MLSQTVKCTCCDHRFTAIPTRSFLGFQKFRCPSCGTTCLYPLTPGYRTTYWVLLAFTTLGIVGTFAQGGFAFPGGLGIAVIIALFCDWRIRMRIEESSIAGDSSESAISGLARRTGVVEQAPVRETRVPPTAVVAPSDEDLWAQALNEFDGAARRPGLWARSFSEAQGIDSVAKASYLGARVKELKDARLTEIRQLALQREEQERLDRLSAIERAEALVPKGECPSCGKIIPLSSPHCPDCKAVFGVYSSWKPTPIKGTEPHAPKIAISSAEEMTTALVAQGCAVKSLSEGGWEVLLPTGVTAFARSAEALQSLAARYVSVGKA